MGERRGRVIKEHVLKDPWTVGLSVGGGAGESGGGKIETTVLEKQ